VYKCKGILWENIFDVNIWWLIWVFRRNFQLKSGEICEKLTLKPVDKRNPWKFQAKLGKFEV
jgi:hypothetical protein